MYYLFALITALWLIPHGGVCQIPTVCADDDSLENLRCCPTTSDGVCGEGASRGSCVTLNLEGYDRNTTDVRANWPHYFTQVCQCNGNYYGYDCSRCRFGYYGTTCSEFQVLPRREIATYTDTEWIEFISILRMVRTRDSGYTAILEEAVPGTTGLEMSNISLYGLYVWVHHVAARNTLDPDLNARQDYAHLGPAFTTWHRYLNLWLEWEIQYLLQSLGQNDYHMFRLPYWDWRIEIQRTTGILSDDLFTERRFGATRNVSGFPRVEGDIIGDGWDTICWQRASMTCDPNVNTGPLQRCPFTGTDPCSSSNPDWPTIQQVNDAIAMDDYDTQPYNILAAKGFRPFLDFKINNDLDGCRGDRMCMCLPFGGLFCDLDSVPEGGVAVAYTSLMHTSGHFILGIGHAKALATLDINETGQIYDPVASPNDPVFIVHHTMIDCMLEEWMERHPNARYPRNVPTTFSTIGHRANDYLVPIFPLHTNAEMFARISEFGYSCNLPNTTVRSTGGGHRVQFEAFTLLCAVITTVMAITLFH